MPLSWRCKQPPHSRYYIDAPRPERSHAAPPPACHDSDVADPDAGTPATTQPYDLSVIDVTWEPCSLEDGADDGLAECAKVQMPLRWGVDDGQTFTTAAKRVVDPPPPSGQLWLLA